MNIFSDSSINTLWHNFIFHLKIKNSYFNFKLPILIDKIILISFEVSLFDKNHYGLIISCETNPIIAFEG